MVQILYQPNALWQSRSIVISDCQVPNIGSLNNDSAEVEGEEQSGRSKDVFHP